MIRDDTLDKMPADTLDKMLAALERIPKLSGGRAAIRIHPSFTGRELRLIRAVLKTGRLPREKKRKGCTP